MYQNTSKVSGHAFEKKSDTSQQPWKNLLRKDRKMMKIKELTDMQYIFDAFCYK